MQHDTSAPASPDPERARIALLEGIARKVLLRAAYNGQRLTLAPHALFARRGELYASAVNLSKKWRADEERRLGIFKLAGLVGVEVTSEPFDAIAPAGAALSPPDAELLLAVS